MEFPEAEAKHLIELALLEDVGPGDVTTGLTFSPEDRLKAKIISKEKGVLCGLPFVELVLASFAADSISFELLAKEGQTLHKGDEILLLEGPAKGLLEAERTILNFMQMLSGVASFTASFVQETKGTRCQILDTRKTLPGFRKLQKYAVAVGGGTNHRMGLYDMVMLKENHLHAAGGISAALEKILREKPAHVKVEVEVENLTQLEEVLAFPVDQIMLDNMSNEDMKSAVQILREKKHEAKLEASGNMTLERIAGVAQTGVDFISVGALTHSVKAHDFSMRFV